METVSHAGWFARRAWLSRGKRAEPFRPKVEQMEERCVPAAFDAVFFWNQVALQATVVDNGATAPRLQIGPTRASRVLAIESLAVFDAVNSIDHSYTPYLTSVQAPPEHSGRRPSPGVGPWKMFHGAMDEGIPLRSQGSGAVFR
jgi:hypothetical protein